MCLWILTACLGLLPSNPTPPATIVVVQGVPTPILQPTTAATTAAATTAATTAVTTAATTAASTRAPVTMAPTPAPTMAPTPAPTMATQPPTMATPPPTMATPAPTMATAAPTTPTAAPTMTTPRPTMSGNFTTSLLTQPPPPPPSPNPTMTTIALTTVASSSSSNIVNPSSAVVEVLPVLLCNDPDVICLFNPDENAAGPIQIDPRLGTTPASALRVPPITGYSGQVPSDSAVKFPRDRRSINYPENLISIKDFLINGSINREKHQIRKRQSCRCVPAGTCVMTTSGAGMIDFRIVTPTAQCPAGQEYCCGSTITPMPSVACGTLQAAPSPVVAPAAGQANYGEYPWQALILTNQNNYIAGGVLIDQLNIITVTHRLTPYIISGTAPNVKVRLGEWDAAGTYEPVPYQEYTVAKVFTHPSYNPNTLQYDITVLRLAASVPLTPMYGSALTINRACLPAMATSTYVGQRCWVSGWGKDMFGLQGQYQQILKEVDVPIVASATCQSQMQTARLGATFMLDTTSFICAGGEANKDSCTGDGGSGLTCNVNGQWVVVGLVSWGLGCANTNVPAAYVNVAALLPWIQQQVAAA